MMRCGPASWFVALALLIGLPDAGTATADVLTAEVSPADARAAVTGTSTLALRYTLTSDAPADEPPDSIASPFGRFVLGLGGSELGRINRRIGGDATRVAPLRLFEAVPVPRSVVAAARQQGASRFLYVREFSADGREFVTTVVQVQLTGGAGAGFSIDQVDLHFDDDAYVRVVPEDAALGAELVLRYSGTGRLRGVWELADPSTTAGSPVFRPLRNVDRQLTGARELRLPAPALPTARAGIHLLRFRMTEPAVSFPLPIIRYAVVTGSEFAPAPVPLVLHGPPERAQIAAGTRFSWAPLAGANAYQIEFYDAPPPEPGSALPALGRDAAPDPAAPGGDAVSGRPVSGMLLPRDRQAAELSALAAEHLLPGREYLYRVIALGEQGRVLGASPLRRVRVRVR